MERNTDKPESKDSLSLRRFCLLQNFHQRSVGTALFDLLPLFFTFAFLMTISAFMLCRCCKWKLFLPSDHFSFLLHNSSSLIEKYLWYFRLICWLRFAWYCQFIHQDHVKLVLVSASAEWIGVFRSRLSRAVTAEGTGYRGCSKYPFSHQLPLISVGTELAQHFPGTSLYCTYLGYKPF